MQYPSGSKFSHNYSFSNDDKTTYRLYNFEVEVKTNINAIPSTLYRLNYTGVLLVDALDSLVFIGITEAVHWIIVSRG